jgi:SAM-dependent methyltransferase
MVEPLPVIDYKLSLLKDTTQIEPSLESIFTNIYTTNAWGARTTVSGSTSTLEKTVELRSNILPVLETLQIQSILDCGCGDFHWMKELSFSSIQYLGVDIVKSMIKNNQFKYTTKSIHFQTMNLILDPPESTDLWFARDFCCLYSFKEIKQFFQKFLDSNSKYIAITSIDSKESNINGITGLWRPLDITAPPFNLQSPIATISDGHQWFRKKTLNIYTREQIQTTFFLSMLFEEPIETSGEIVPVNPEKNAHLVNNVRLRDIKLPSFTKEPSKK